MTPTQLAEIHRVCLPDSAWSEASFAAQLAQPGVFVLGNETGFILCRTAADECEILTFAVLPAHQRKGIGQQLLESALERTDAKTMFLEVAEDNIAALKLYANAGFKEVSRRKKYYSGKVDAVVMRKPITAS